METKEVEGKGKRKSEKRDERKGNEKQTQDCEENDVSENGDKVEIGINMPLSSFDVTKISSSHKKKKKAKKTQYESELLSGRKIEKTEGEEKTINADVTDKMTTGKPSKSCDVATAKMKEKTEGNEMEVNTEIKDKTDNHMPSSSGDTAEETGGHKKNEKVKKWKHESHLATENILEETESNQKEVNTDVKDKTDNDMSLSSGDVTEKSGGHKKRKKAKKQKHESDLVTENMVEKTESKGKEITTDAKDKIGNDMPPSSSGDVTEESNSRKKGEKAKKWKHESDLATESILEETESNQKEVNTDVKDKTDNHMPSSSGNTTEETGGHKKKEKLKKQKQKHQSDLVTENIVEKTKSKGKEITTDAKDKIGNDVPPSSSGDVTEKSGGHKKRKKVTKQKHESDLATENILEETESNQKEVNTDVKDKTGNDMSLSSGDVTEKSGGYKKREKATKQKHECDLATETILERTESNQKEVNTDVKDKTDNHMPSSSGNTTEEASGHKKKEKLKKQKHESDLVTENIVEKTKSKGKEITTDAKDKIGNDVPPSSSGDVTEKSGGHKKRKKVTKHKHESDLATENILEETESNQKEVNTDVKDKTGSDRSLSSGDVTEKSISRKKGEKAKKRKHESNFVTEKMENTEVSGKEVNTDVKDKIENDVPPSSGDVTESSGHKKRKKATKQKHESDLVTANMVEKTESKEKELNTDVKDRTDNDVPPSSCDVTVDSGSHTKRKKERKQKRESDLGTKKMEENTECKQKEVNTDVKDKTDNDMSLSGGDATEKSGGHKKRKKAKKQKHESDLGAEKMAEKTERKVKEANTDVKDKINNDMPPSNAHVKEVFGTHKKRKKGNTHEKSGLGAENILEETESKGKEVNTDVKDKIGNDMPLSSSDVTEDSGSHKKRKKKKQKHESDLPTEIMVEENESKLKEVNTDVIDMIGNDMPPSSGDLTEVSGSHKKRKKERKHEGETVIEKMEEKTESKENEVNTDLKDEVDNVPPSSSDGTVESGCHKRKKGTKHKHKIDLATVEVEENTEGKDREVNTEVQDKIGNDIPPPSSADIIEELSSNKKRKKEKKHKHESYLAAEKIDEKTEGKEKEVHADVKNEIGDMPPSISDVSDKSGSRKKRNKAKKRKHESDMSLEIISRKHDCEEKDAKACVKDGLQKNTRTTSCDVTKGSGSHNMEKELGENMDTKHRLNAPSFDSSQEPTNAKHDAERTKEITNNLDVVEISTLTIDVDKELQNEETNKILAVTSERSELDEKKKIDYKTGNQWESAEFGSAEQKEKFLRLMGAFKPSNKQRETSNCSSMAMNKHQEKAFASSLEKQYFQATQTRKGKGVGLGYE